MTYPELLPHHQPDLAPSPGRGRGNIFIRDCIRRGMHLNKEGRIVSPNGHVHSGKAIVRGYRRISLWAFGQDLAVTYAKVICWLSHGPPPTYDAVADHIDRNSLNDDPKNLRWATPSENCLNVSKATKRARQEWMRQMPRPKGECHGHSKLTTKQVRRIRLEKKEGASLDDLANCYSVSKQTISKIVRRERWRHVHD